MPHREERALAGRDRECEVVVVGAEPSGLAAARQPARATVHTLVLFARHGVVPRRRPVRRPPTEPARRERGT